MTSRVNQYMFLTHHPHPTGGVLWVKISMYLSIKFSKVSQECSDPERLHSKYSGRSRVIRGREGRREGWEGVSRAKLGIQLVLYNALLKNMGDVCICH